MSFVCTGLPAGIQCGPDNFLYTAGPSTGFGVNHNQLAANDYPFQITGTANTVSHTIKAVLRVGDFTASLDKTTATLSKGQSATFNVTLTSVNHYASSITLFCQSPNNNLTCAFSPTPAPLTDGGTAMVQLTVTDTATTSKLRHAVWHPSRACFLVASLLSLSFVVVRRKGSPLLALIAITALASVISCGGSGNTVMTGGGGTGGGGGGGTPQTVSLTVVAQAAASQSDNSNQ